MRSSRQFSFSNGSNKLVFVRMYGSTFTDLVRPPYPCCSPVAFCVFFVLYYTHKNTHRQKLTSKRKQQIFARANF